MREEQTTLMTRTFPRLREFAARLGYDFRVVDLRLGMRETITDDHMTAEISISELKTCQRVSTGPTFVVSSYVFNILYTYVYFAQFCLFIFLSLGFSRYCSI